MHFFPTLTNWLVKTAGVFGNRYTASELLHSLSA
jgi:hypothetical protein